MPNREDEIGALWERTSAKGTTYWSGHINGVDVVVFVNAHAEGKQPTHRVYKSQPRERSFEPRKAVQSRVDDDEISF